MNKYHQEIVKLYASYQGNYSSKHDSNYAGSRKFSYPISIPASRKLIKDWLKSQPPFTPAQYRRLLDSLSRGKSHSEFSAIGKLLEYCPKLRQTLDTEALDFWLDKAEGWAEVDSICQGNFTAEEILSRWPVWRKLIQNFAADKNVHKRRASLVLLTGPVRRNADSRLSKLAFENINNLKSEKHILITKAISWLLRELIANHRSKVTAYIKQNKNSFPKIAVRETQNKLLSGRKSGKER
jgi:3-methyladenine DNA glycosylase AlkD